MLKALSAACLVGVSLFSVQAAHSAEGDTCRKVRMAEPGWNDLTFTTGTGMVLLKALGYEAESSTLGIEVIYQAMKENDLDAFLGYWDPSMAIYYKPYRDDGSIEMVRTNLIGAKYTFAVPTYVWEAGVKDFKDLEKVRRQV